MTIQGTISITASIGGVSIQTTTTVEATAQGSQDVALDIAQEGDLTTRTSDTAGTFTADSAGHGIVDADVVDLYWSGGVAYGAIVGTVASDVIPFTAASGDVLPSQDTAMDISKVTTLEETIDCDLIQQLVAVLPSRGHVVFEETADALADAQELLANMPYMYYADSSMTNPLAGKTLAEIHVSSADIVTAQRFKLGYIYDSES